MSWAEEAVFPLLIITPSSGFTGLFAYSPGPGLGNLVASVTSSSGTDPYGNQFFAGVQSYGASVSTGSRNLATGAGAVLTNAELAFSIGVVFTAGATVGAQQQSISSQGRPVMQAAAPQQAGSLDGAVVSLLGGDTGGVNHGMMLVALSPTAAQTTTALLEVQGTLALSETATPPTPTGAGILFVDNTGHLRYLGPAGTNTLLANP